MMPGLLVPTRHKAELKDPLLVGMAQLFLDFYIEVQKRKYRKNEKHERKSISKTV